jgi:hypothetical protein
MTYMLLPVITHSAGFMRRAPRLFSTALQFPLNRLFPPLLTVGAEFLRLASLLERLKATDYRSAAPGPPGARRYPLISKSC